MTFDDRKVSLPETTEHEDAASTQKTAETGAPHGIDKSTPDIPHGLEAQDARHRHGYEFHSMTVPIIKEPQEPWGEVDAEPPVRPSDGESDDAGDIFHTSYEEGPLTALGAPSNPSSDDPIDE